MGEMSERGLTRERVDILHEILVAIGDNEEMRRTSKTRIMGLVNCNWTLFSQLLDTLLSRGFVTWHPWGSRRILMLTEVGVVYVKILADISEMVNESRNMQPLLQVVA